MRTARLQGPSDDGRALVVVTDDDERLEVRVDTRLREAVRSTPRSRQGHLEIQMESALRPREMQARIRSGQSVEDVALAAGVPVERVEPWAAPVLAEREHVAGLAQRSTVRRRGETSGHRKLQAALTERLGARGVDAETLRWDSARTDDGRWAVSAAYDSGEARREAVFLFDVAARYSVAGNDDARWVLGESSPAKGPQPGRRRPAVAGATDPAEPLAGATEPTLDLSDELALVRATQDAPLDHQAEPDQVEHDHAEPEQAEPEQAEPKQVEPVTEVEEDPTDRVEPVAASQVIADLETVDSAPAVPQSASQLDTFYAMLDGYTEESVSVYPGLERGDWEPEIVVDEPVGLVGPDAGPEDAPSDDSTEEEQHEWERSPFPIAPEEGEGTEEIDPAAIPDTTGVPAAPAEEDAVPDPPGAPEAQTAPAPTAKPAVRRKKRASVPSWDEIMFGGPSRPGGSGR